MINICNDKYNYVMNINHRLVYISLIFLVISLLCFLSNSTS